jgi:hypothetical protein
MHATAVLQTCLGDALGAMHTLRARVLLGAVAALGRGRRLVLMDLARAWPGAERVRAPLKRLDRLLGNRHLHAERSRLYAALIPWLIRQSQPVILIDWSPLKADGRWQLLRAAVPGVGRSLTLYEEIHPQHLQANPRIERQFLQQLQALLPATVRPIVVTDAGFRTPWMRAVAALGWDYVGRVRGRVLIRYQQRWQPARALYAQATAQPRPLAAAALTCQKPWPCRLVLLHRQPQGRIDRSLRGQRRYSRTSRKAAARTREPWLLATSLHCSARRIAALYAQRMQIEEAFRDLKSERFGCGLELSLTRSRERLAVLLLLHLLASFVAYLTGLASRQQKTTAHCDPQPSLARTRYSIMRLGWEALRRGQPHFRPPELIHALNTAPITT